MVKFTPKGDFAKVTRYLNQTNKAVKNFNLDRYGRQGVAALASATPVESGETANSWHYKVEKKNGRAAISFYNSNIQNGCPIAIILQYGHGTRTGGWVEGRDYINPAIQPLFDKITDDAWREVTKR